MKNRARLRVELGIGRIMSRLAVCTHTYKHTMFRRQYEVARSFTFWEGSRIYGEGRAILGENSYMNRGSSFQVSQGAILRIGHDTRIGPNVHVYTSTTDADSGGSITTARDGDVTIGDFVWIGANVFIGPDITIGDNAVVGANSVVTHSVAPWEIVGGVPARHIRFKRCAGDDRLTKLNKPNR